MTLISSGGAPLWHRSEGERRKHRRKDKTFHKAGHSNWIWTVVHSFIGWMIRPQSLYMGVCCSTFFFFLINNKGIVSFNRQLMGRSGSLSFEQSSRVALPYNQLCSLRNANCCLTTIQNCVYACCMNNSHKNIFQTADWARLFSHRMWISHCRKSTPVFRNFLHQPITMAVQNVHHICFPKNIDTDDQKLKIFVS